MRDFKILIFFLLVFLFGQKKDQIIINVLAAFSINKTLSFLKKIKK